VREPEAPIFGATIGKPSALLAIVGAILAFEDRCGVGGGWELNAVVLLIASFWRMPCDEKEGRCCECNPTFGSCGGRGGRRVEMEEGSRAGFTPLNRAEEWFGRREDDEMKEAGRSPAATKACRL
jgi:hypothetical protein